MSNDRTYRPSVVVATTQDVIVASSRGHNIVNVINDSPICGYFWKKLLNRCTLREKLVHNTLTKISTHFVMGAQNDDAIRPHVFELLTSTHFLLTLTQRYLRERSVWIGAVAQPVLIRIRNFSFR